MKSIRTGRTWAILPVIVTALSVADAFADSGTSTGNPAPATVFWVSFGIMTGLLLILFVIVALGLLRNKDWRLSDALSEEAGNQPNPLPVGTKPVMVASASRLIALLGLLVIMVLFLGFGYYILYAAFKGQMDQINTSKIMGFLFSGATMFAPYLANQLQTAFAAFSKQ